MAKLNLRGLFGEFRPHQCEEAQEKIGNLVRRRDPSTVHHVLRVSDLSPGVRKALAAALVGLAVLGGSAVGLSMFSSHLARVNRQQEVELRRIEEHGRQQEFRSYQQEQKARRRRGLPVQFLDEYRRSTYGLPPTSSVRQAEPRPPQNVPKWVPSEDDVRPEPSPTTRKPDLRKLARQAIKSTRGRS